jgi:integrase/recombinase XerC/integrase/recombinase XerD
MARHANINTTLIYSHNIDRVRDAPERKIDVLLSEARTIEGTGL